MEQIDTIRGGGRNWLKNGEGISQRKYKHSARTQTIVWHWHREEGKEDWAKGQRYGYL